MFVFTRPHWLLWVTDCGGAGKSGGTWKELLPVSRGELVVWTRVQAVQCREAGGTQIHHGGWINRIG